MSEQTMSMAECNVGDRVEVVDAIADGFGENRRGAGIVGVYLLVTYLSSWGLPPIDWEGGTGFAGWLREVHFVCIGLCGLIGLLLCLIGFAPRRKERRA